MKEPGLQLILAFQLISSLLEDISLNQALNLLLFFLLPLSFSLFVILVACLVYIALIHNPLKVFAALKIIQSTLKIRQRGKSVSPKIACVNQLFGFLIFPLGENKNRHSYLNYDFYLASEYDHGRALRRRGYSYCQVGRRRRILSSPDSKD